MSNKIIIYNTEDGKSKINLKLEDGTVWLNQLQIAELFQTTKQNISKHIKAIFEDDELSEVSRGWPKSIKKSQEKIDKNSFLGFLNNFWEKF